MDETDLEINGPVRDMVLGTDLVFVPRLVAAENRHGPAFFERLLTPAEMQYCRDCAPKLFVQRTGGRIAVKEAVAKALGTGLNGLGWGRGVDWKDIEVVGQSQSPPGIRLSGRALVVSNRLRVARWRVSLSHDGDYAMATVIGLVGDSTG